VHPVSIVCTQKNVNILGVLSIHVETVALLSKLDVDKHISVEIELDEMDLTSTESKATYAQFHFVICFKSGIEMEV